MIYYNTNKITIKQKLQFENYGNGKILSKFAGQLLTKVIRVDTRRD